MFKALKDFIISGYGKVKKGDEHPENFYTKPLIEKGGYFEKVPDVKKSKKGDTL